MSTLIFDLECDALLPDVTKIWGMGYSWHGRGEITWTTDLTLMRWVLATSDTLVGHNIIGYDLPVIKKLLGWEPRSEQVLHDTLTFSRLIYTDLAVKDKIAKSYTLSPGSRKKPHSLGAWGERMGEHKGTPPPFNVYSPEMAEYCKQDVRVTVKLYEHMLSLNYAEEAIKLEHDFATIIQRQHEHGVRFDKTRAATLYIQLYKDKEVLVKRLSSIFGGFFQPNGVFTPKRDNKTRGYTAGLAFTRIKWMSFNPASNHHVGRVLKTKYGWKPKKYGQDGHPTVDEGVLDSLDYPEAKLFKELKVINKLLGYLGDGKESWLKNEKEGRIHGSINTNGAVTGRCTHSKPNLGNVPSARAKYGKECRALFTAANKPSVLLGFDASGLEQCALAGYLFAWDKGDYASWVVSGVKEKGTDPHSLQSKILGVSRDTQKTWFYAYLYGAQNPKLGSILGGGSSAGERSRKTMEGRIPALAKLQAAVKKKVEKPGYIIGLDGRHVRIRSEHAALNSLLQSAGAVLMKRFLVILDKFLQSLGYISGEDYEYVLNVHDEIQVECCSKHVAKTIGESCKIAMRKAGEYYDFKCPLKGEYKIGNNWSETH